MPRILVRTYIVLQLAFLAAPAISAYSVLTHEAIVDSLWDDAFKPLLLKRFPGTTADQLLEAHAYAYGGAIMQDLGYYPFGSKFFSDLVHYVRTGDFIEALLRDASTVNEYSFALGALAHHASDNIGHPEAVNIVEPMLYPKIQRKYGDTVTYEDNPGDHLKTEFGFDVLEVARGNYAPQAYHDFIGFEVAKPLLERAFEETYSIPLKDVFSKLDLALGTYRHTVSGLIPEMTKAAWAAKKDDIEKAHPGTTQRRFIYNLRRASYEKEWGREYDRPGIGARILSFFLKIVPKIGPFKALAFKMPNAQGETLFMRSFNDTLAHYRADVRGLNSGLRLANTNFDTGKPTRQGEYRMADDAYAKLLRTFADKNVQPSPEMRANVLAFYRNPAAITDSKAREEFDALKQGGPVVAPAAGAEQKPPA